MLLFVAPLSLSAVVFKAFAEEPPAVGSPADVYISFLKAGSLDDVETMRVHAHGYVLRQLDKEETKKSYIDRAKDIDWEKPMNWAQKIDGNSAKVAVNYYLKSNGRLWRSKIKMSNVDGHWKYGD